MATLIGINEPLWLLGSSAYVNGSKVTDFEPEADPDGNTAWLANAFARDRLNPTLRGLTLGPGTFTVAGGSVLVAVTSGTSSGYVFLDATDASNIGTPTTDSRGGLKVTASISNTAYTMTITRGDIEGGRNCRYWSLLYLNRYGVWSAMNFLGRCIAGRSVSRTTWQREYGYSDRSKGAGGLTTLREEVNDTFTLNTGRIEAPEWTRDGDGGAVTDIVSSPELWLNCSDNNAFTEVVCTETSRSWQAGWANYTVAVKTVNPKVLTLA